MMGSTVRLKYGQAELFSSKEIAQNKGYFGAGISIANLMSGFHFYLLVPTLFNLRTKRFVKKFDNPIWQAQFL